MDFFPENIPPQYFICCTTLFKFTKPPDGLTRRVMFYKQPTWDELADKLQNLYSIPKDNVGVSYVDADGDEVTLSSQDELQDFYQLNLQAVRGFGQSGDAMKAVRFTVHDLSIVRDSNSDKPLPRTPSTGSNLNNNTTMSTQIKNIYAIGASRNIGYFASLRLLGTYTCEISTVAFSFCLFYSS